MISNDTQTINEENNNSYTFSDICEIDEIVKRNKQGEEYITKVYTYLPDKLATKIIQLEKIHKTEQGIYVYNGEFYESLSKDHNIIDHLVNVNYGHNSLIDTYCKDILNMPTNVLPQKKVNNSFRTELHHNIKAKLELQNFHDIFNTIQLKDKDFCLVVNNGLYHFDSKELRPFNDEYKSTNKIETDYIDITKDQKLMDIYREWINLIDSYVETQEDKIRLQELTAIGLLNVPFMKETCWLKGPSNTGKSTYENIFKFILGNSNFSTVSLSQLENDRYATADLLNKTANFSSDKSKMELNDLEKFMNITGRDGIRTRQIYKQAFNGVKIYQQWFVSINQFPKGDFKYEDKFLNRIIIIMFKKLIGDIIDAYENLWNTPERKSVILYWLIEGLHRLREKGFSYPQSNDSKLLLINQESMESFFDECIDYFEYINENFDNLETNNYELFNKYIERAKKYGLQYIDKKLFTREFNSFLKEDFNKVMIKRTKEKIENIETKQDELMNIYKYTGITLN